MYLLGLLFIIEDMQHSRLGQQIPSKPEAFWHGRQDEHPGWQPGPHRGHHSWTYPWWHFICSYFLLRLKVCGQGGLGDNFQPSVKPSCVGGTMNIRVDTLDPFEGIIHGPNRSEPGCSVQGRGGLKTYLRIDLTKTEGQTGGCGVKYNEVRIKGSIPESFCNSAKYS